MKYAKTLGLAAVAVAALMAFLGAGTASATVLCATEPVEGSPATKGTVCPTGFAYLAGTEFHAVLDPGTVSKTTSETFNSECKKSTIKGKVENEGSATETVGITVEALTFEECNCEYKVLKTGTIEIHWIKDTFNGTVTWNGMEKTVLCNTIFGPVHCIYVTNNTDIGELTGGNPATLDVDAKLPWLSTSGLCTEHTWEAKYEITAPKPLYVAAHT